MLPAVLAPLIFARQVFYRSRALEEAHVELQEREEILRELSNTMAEERADERLQIAGYLHDDLAQVLFRLSLQVDIARKMLDKQDLDDLRDQLEKIDAPAFGVVANFADRHDRGGDLAGYASKPTS